MYEEDRDWFFIITTVVVAFVLGGLVVLFTKLNPYSFTAKYCAGELCSIEKGLTADTCPQTKQIDTGFSSNITGEIVKGSCEVKK